MEHPCNPLVDFTFDGDDKFAYVCSLAKPFGLISSGDCGVNAGTILQIKCIQANLPQMTLQLMFYTLENMNFDVNLFEGLLGHLPLPYK